jgi:hypothetical protein
MKHPTRGRRPAHPASALPPGTTGAARRRLIEAQAARVEAQNGVRAGELLEVAAVEAVWREILATVKQRLLALPSALAPGLAAESNPQRIYTILENAIHDALQALSEWRPPPPANQPD